MSAGPHYDRRGMSEIAVIEQGDELEVRADLSGLSLADLAAAANREHRLAQEADLSFLDHAIRSGHLLLAAQVGMLWGEWGSWLTLEFNGGSSTASLYMRLATYEDTIRGLGVTSQGSARSCLKELALRRSRDAISMSVRQEACRLARTTERSQQEVAEIFGVSAATISTWLHPERQVKRTRENQRKRRLFAEAWQRQEKDRAARRVGGDLGRAYEFTRKLAEMLDAAATSEANPFSRVAISSALRKLYGVEDEINKAIGTHVPVESKGA